MPAHLFGGKTVLSKFSKFSKNPIGTGYYKFDKETKNHDVILTAFKEHYGGAANIDLLSSAGAISQGGNITSAGGAVSLDAFTLLTMGDGVRATSSTGGAKLTGHAQPCASSSVSPGGRSGKSSRTGPEGRSNSFRQSCNTRR